ncbi:hypothetical protein NA56DRAFT_662690 [Hyaloscypha hepaticicola]|uniref:C2H2-type domain-containing protein n=1 Tax=Hyaloscypha hepaticicola TaxID=2082293 RepID=A0A2J6PS57_9HELO|nr:hypothetical protein NA56DRAFT_662690 [Hyaloscypha hepaticicola]
MFWCLITGDDSRPKPSSRRSDGITLAPRATAKMQTPGEIAGLVLGIILGVLAIGVIVWLFCRAKRCKGYRGSDSTAETRRETHWEKAELDSSRNAIISIPHDSHELGLNFGRYSAGPPMLFWKPTEVERDLASRISMAVPLSEAVPETLSLSSAENCYEDDEAAAISSHFPCPEPSCSRTFSKQYKLNHHMRYHAKSKQCPTCSKSFGTVTHLERHSNSAHSRTRLGGDAVFFSRKDNWRRHMEKKHGTQYL